MAKSFDLGNFANFITANGLSNTVTIANNLTVNTTSFVVNTTNILINNSIISIGNSSVNTQIYSNRIESNQLDTSSTPSYTWSGDNTTGVFRSAEGQIGLSSSGTTEILCNSSLVVVNNNMTITSNTLTLGLSSISSNGYSRLPNGLLMQWGSVASNTSVGNITFPTEFITLYSITAATLSTTATAASTYTPVVLAANTSTANVRTANVTSRTVYWQAIGN